MYHSVPWPCWESAYSANKHNPELIRYYWHIHRIAEILSEEVV
jgi:hypothetical protein